MNKPRPFSHKLIYVDERQELLEGIEQQARQELGLDEHAVNPSRLQGVFTAGRKNGQGRTTAWSIPMLLSLLLILLAVTMLVLFSET